MARPGIRRQFEQARQPTIAITFILGEYRMKVEQSDRQPTCCSTVRTTDQCFPFGRIKRGHAGEITIKKHRIPWCVFIMVFGVLLLLSRLVTIRPFHHSGPADSADTAVHGPGPVRRIMVGRSHPASVLIIRPKAGIRKTRNLDASPPENSYKRRLSRHLRELKYGKSTLKPCRSG